MSDITYNLRNIGETGVVWGGQMLGVTGFYGIQYPDMDLLINDSSFMAALETGMAVVSNNNGDLNPGDAIRALKRESIIIGEESFSESSQESSTTSESYETKINHNFSVDFSGTYVVLVSALISSTGSSNLIYNRLLIDDTEVRKEIIRNLNGLRYRDGAYYEYCVNAVIDFDSGSHNIKLQYHSSQNKTAYIKEASIIVNRLASRSSNV